MALWKPPKQRTLLQADEAPTTFFQEELRCSNRLHKALNKEKKSSAPGQEEFQRLRAQQQQYVIDARRRELPPLDRVVEQQELLGELRRDAHHLAPKSAETPAELEKRMKQREAFLAGRKTRHDDAIEKFERNVDTLSDECQVSAREASQRMKQAVERKHGEIVKTLAPLEEEIDLLGERSEEEVHGIMTDLERIIEVQRSHVRDFQKNLEDIDSFRKDETTKLTMALVETLTAAAHVVPGEVERLVEERTLELNNILLENQKAAKTLVSKLTVQTLEKSKECKVRWHAGLLLWKKKRHHHSLAEVMARIASNEFRQPDVLVEILQRFRDRQRQVFDRRSAMVSEFYSTSMVDLQASLVRQWEEQNNTFNDRTQDQFEALFGELKEIKDSLEISGEGMLSALCQELEAHDARSEWGEHGSVRDLVDAECRPHLKECIDIVGKLLVEVIDVVTRLDENQHAVVVKLIAWFLSLAKKRETCTNNRNMLYDVQYPGELEDTEIAHENRCADNESKMEGIKTGINDSAHHEDLDKMKQEAFDQLDEIEQEYRNHAATTTTIHRAYPHQVAALMQNETEAFSQELGLITEAALHPPSEEGEDGAEAAAKDKEEEEHDYPEWSEGDGTGCQVMEKLTLAKLREGLVGGLGTAPPKPVADEDAEGGAEAAPEEPEQPGTEDPDEGNPRQADGEPVLEMLNFQPDWLEGKLQGTRTKIFKHLTGMKKGLYIDVESHCEDVAHNLDQVLRKHTNRKGEVQVELYVPRYGVITKHKDRFERHLIEVAKKSHDSDDKTDELYVEIEAKEKSYQESLLALQEKLGEAETLPMLNAFETKANKAAKEFGQVCKQLNNKLSVLAKDAPKALQVENENFLMMCNRGQGDPYSASEVQFYSAEVAELNTSLTERGQLRQDRLSELEEKLPNMSKVPLAEFITHYKEAVEQLCASKGYGTEHGAPRRRAQERCRTLIARASTVKQNIADLMQHFTELCDLPFANAEAVSLSRLPKGPQFELYDYFKKYGDQWVFTGEVIGNFYILTCAMNSLGTHLEAFKQEAAASYKLEGMPQLRVLSEVEAIVSTEAADDVKSSEVALKDQCLMQVLGPVLNADAFGSEIQSITKEAHDTYASKGGTPEFMLTFLKEMEVSSNRARQEVALAVRESSDKLRNETLLTLGDAVYGELTTRSVREMAKSLREVQEKMAYAWEDIDRRRASNEKRLGPRLSNPNAEQELQDLISEEGERFKTALTQIGQDRASIVLAFRHQADLFVQRMSAAFEATFKLLDAVPLPAHFAPLPGDEQVEPARMSIKRRMRRMQNGQSVDQYGDNLPGRSWPGIRRYELRETLRGSEWPKDDQLSDATDDMLAELTPPVDSFRSATHKKLFERRNFYYNQYVSEFMRELKNRTVKLADREEKEQAGQVNWTAMVKQLNPDATIPDVTAEEEVVEDEKPPEPDPKAKAKAKGK